MISYGGFDSAGCEFEAPRGDFDFDDPVLYVSVGLPPNPEERNAYFAETTLVKARAERSENFMVAFEWK